MPKYFFDIHDGRVDRDGDGVDYANVETARREALRASGDMLRDKEVIGAGSSWMMVVRDECDHVVSTFVFSAH